MLNNKRSSDVYRKLRTNIEFNNKYPNIQSICLTSVNKGSGTTKIACNLASTFLLNHSNVLLVDCNFNKPKINKIFNVNNSFGLCDLLISDDYTNYYKYCTKFKDEHSNNLLYVMGTGQKVRNSLDLLSSQHFKEFINEMEKQFDFILIDCPSLEDSNDAIPIGHAVDGTILIVSVPETEKNIAKRTVQQLIRNDVVVLGVVLNKVE